MRQLRQPVGQKGRAESNEAIPGARENEAFSPLTVQAIGYGLRIFNRHQYCFRIGSDRHLSRLVIHTAMKVGAVSTEFFQERKLSLLTSVRPK